MRLVGLILMVLTQLVVSAASGNEIKEADCNSLKAYSRTHGFAFQIMWFNAVYPTAVQSQKCPENVRMTGKLLKNFVINYAAASGCGPKTAVYQAMVEPFDEVKMETTLSNQKLSEIPDRYLSKDPNFCTSEKLAAMIACSDSPDSCFEAPSK